MRQEIRMSFERHSTVAERDANVAQASSPASSGTVPVPGIVFVYGMAAGNRV